MNLVRKKIMNLAVNIVGKLFNQIGYLKAHVEEVAGSTKIVSGINVKKGFHSQNKIQL